MMQMMQELISIPRTSVELMCRFYSKCLDAERFFEACQAPSYQRFISGNVTNADIRAAFEETQRRLTLAESKAGGRAEADAKAEADEAEEKKTAARSSEAKGSVKEQRKVKAVQPDPGVIPVIPAVP